MCFVANFVDEWLECWDFDKVTDEVTLKILPERGWTAAE